MRRSDFGKRSNSNAGGRGNGLFGSLFGGQSGGQREPQQPGQATSEKITARGGGKVTPTIKQVSIGISPYGDVVNLPLWERHCLLAGQSGSGKSWVANRLLGEVFQIEKSDRVVAVVDCKGAVEGAKWQHVADAVVGTIEEADTLFTNIDAEMKRRESLVKSDIAKYWDSRIHPNKNTPLCVIYIDELAVLGNPIKEDKELEAIRKHAMYMLNELLFRARSSAICVITAIQRPDAATLGGGSMRNNLQNRLIGRVDTSGSSDVCLGAGMAAEGVDASKLSDHWFIAQIEGKGIFRFKTPGEFDDSDLKNVALNPEYYCPKGRGDWLTAEPDTPESIAPWWPDSPYHDAFLRDFREEGEDEEGDGDGFGFQATRDSSTNAGSTSTRRPADPASKADDYDDLEECEPFWEDDQSSPRRAPSRTPRQAPRQATRPSRSRSPQDAEPDIEEIPMEDLMRMIEEDEAARTQVDDLNASFEEIEDDSPDAYETWGDSIFAEDEDEESDELVDDYDQAWWGAMSDQKGDDEIMALPPRGASRPTPKALPRTAYGGKKGAKPDAERDREIVIETRRKTDGATSASGTSTSDGTAGRGTGAPRSRRRKRASTSPRRNGTPLV